MNEEFDSNSGIDAELQVRLMNLVMGEASDFERDQLQAMMEERTELAAYYQHLEHLHGLLREVGAGEPSLEAEASDSADAWQLPVDRREKLLAVLDGKVEEPTTPVRLATSVSAKLKPYLTRRWLSGLAVAAASLLLGMVIFPRRAAKELLSQRDQALHLSVAHLTEGLEAEAAVSQAVRMSRRNSQVELEQRTSGITSAPIHRSKVLAPTSSSPSPYYLTDDVQYFPPSGPSAADTPSAGRPGVQLAAPATDANGTITFGRGGELSDWAKSSRDRFDRDGQVSMPGIGPSTAGDALPGKPGSSSSAETDDVSKPGQVDTIDFFDSGVPFGNRAKSESGAGAPNQPTSGGGSNLERNRESLSWSVDLPKLELSEFDRLDSDGDGEIRDLAETTTTVPDGGSIMLGVIIKNRSLAAIDRASDDFFGVPGPSTLLLPVTPRIVVDEEEEARLGVANPFYSVPTDSVSDLYGANETDQLAGGNNLQDARGSGSVEKAQLDSSLLGEVQVEVVDSVGLAIVKGSERDVQRTLKAIDQIKQQGQPESDAEQAKRTGDAKADTSGPESQANAEWFRKQVGGFQAARGEEVELPQDAPVDSLQAAKKKLAELREKLNGTIRAQNKEAAESSNRFAMEKALNSENLFSQDTKQSNTTNPMPASPESLRQVEGFGWAGKEGSKQQVSKQEAPSPEVAAAGRYRLAPAPVAAGTVTEGILAETKPSSEKAAESKAESETGITEGRGRALSKKPAEPSQQELARIATGTALSRSLRRPSIDEQSAAQEAFSTFSLHVSDVSFKLAQTALSQGQWPEAAKIRIEEFVNALDYRDPLPTGNEKVACRIEQAIHPFLIQRNMLRVSMRTAATGRSQNTPLRLTVLLDNSGSMERPDRRQAVLRAFQTLSAQLKASDQITLISFASSPRLLADKVPGNQGETLLQLIENLPSEGGTNIESALMLAREKAVEQQLAGAQNRIVLLTDGAVNLGNANPDSLAKMVTQLRDSGIAFDAAGISAHDLNDEVLEALTRQGDGRYYLLDSAESATESFAAQIAGALRPSAQNVKVQVEFNPQRVGRYKLLGFEKHRLNKEDFRNDKVDAAEMAAAEAGVAVYQFEIKPNGVGDVGSVSVRFRDLTTGRMVENRWPIPYESNAPRLEQAEPSMQLAACAALFAAKLSGGPLGDGVDLSQLRSLLANLPEQVVSQPRVQQLRAMIEQASAK